MEFGRSLRSLWYLDPHLTYLNHGTVGATPKAVLDAQFALVREIERHPADFILRSLSANTSTPDPSSRIRVAAAHVADFVGADPANVVPVDNITTAANAVFQSFPLHRDDEVVSTSLGYGGVTNALMYAARVKGAAHREIAMPLPGADPSIYRDAVINGLSDDTRLLVIDHITARTALLLPVVEIASAAKERGIAVFVDGAHVPGNCPLDVEAIGADFYAANLHKWAMAPRSTGFLWVAPEHHASTHAPIVSWGLDNGISAEFDLPGTRDPSAFLTVPFALDYLANLGGDGGIDAVFAHNHSLAWRAGSTLANAWDRPFTTPESMIASMVTVPLPRALGSTATDAECVRMSLAAMNIEVPVFPLGDSLWTRVSAQVYCDQDDVLRLASVVQELASSTTT